MSLAGTPAAICTRAIDVSNVAAALIDSTATKPRATVDAAPIALRLRPSRSVAASDFTAVASISAPSLRNVGVAKSRARIS